MNNIKDPKFGATGYGAHAFNPCCDTHGGSSFRHWCSLFFHKGIFIGYDNYDWVVYVSSDPNAEWSRGCQNSCAHGNPFPSSKTAKLLAWKSCPEEVQKKAYPLVLEAIEICNTLIQEYKEKKVKEIEKLEKEKRAREEQIIKNWG